MPHDLPQFKSTATVNVSPAANVQDSMQTLANSLGNFSQKVMAARGQVVKERVTQEGSELGASPDFTGKLAVGATQATREFNEAALSSNKISKLMHVRSGVRSLSDNILAPENFSLSNDPVGTYESQLAKFSQETLSNTPEQNQLAVKSYLNFYGNNAKNSILAKSKSLTLNAGRDYYKDTISKITDDSVNAAYNGASQGAAALFGQGSQLTELANKLDLISPEEGKENREQWLSALQTNTALGGYQHALNEGKGPEYIEAHNNKKFADLDPNQRLQLNMKMLGTKHIYDQTNDVRSANIQGQMEQQNIAIQNGQPLNTELMARVKKLDPAFYAKWQPRLAEAELMNTASSQLRYLNPVDRLTALQSLENTAGVLAPEKVGRIVRGMQSVSMKQMKAAVNDPASYTWNHPAVQEARAARQISIQAQAEVNDPVITPSGDVNAKRLLQPAIDPSQVAPYNVDPNQAMLNVQKAMGIPADERSVIPKTAASNFVKTLLQSNSNTQVMALKAELSQYGSHGVVAMRDLNKAGLPVGYQMMLSASNNPESSADVPAMINAFNTPKKEIDSDLKASGIAVSQMNAAIETNLSSYFSSLSGYNGNMITLRNNVRESVKSLAAQLMIVHPNMSMDKAVERSANSLVNNNFQYVSQPNGTTLRMPPQMDASTLLDTRKALVYHASKSNLLVPDEFNVTFANLPEAQREVQYQQFVARNAQLISNKSSTGYILVLDNGSPVKAKNGGQIEISDAEINDPTSDIHKLIDQTPTETIGAISRLASVSQVGG